MAVTRAIALMTIALAVLLGGCKQIQDSLLYYPARLYGAPPSPPTGWTVEPLSFERPDNVELHGWLVKRVAAGPLPLVLYFGGNAEEVSWQIASVDRLGAGAIALVNYRGYGRSTGSPSEAALLGDALAVHDALAQRADIDRARMAVMGRSLGTGVAVHVAANRPIERAVLISPYDSIEAVGRAHFPAWLVRMVLQDRYDAAQLAPSIRAPLLAIVAGRDEIIPVERSRSLFDAWAGAKRWVELPGSGHNHVQEFPQYWKAISSFLAGT